MSRNIVIKGYGYQGSGKAYRPEVKVTSEVRAEPVDLSLLGGLSSEVEVSLEAQLSINNQADTAQSQILAGLSADLEGSLEGELTSESPLLED